LKEGEDADYYDPKTKDDKDQRKIQQLEAETQKI